MSWYTAGEILIWLILAAVLGFALGWLVRWLTSRRGSTLGDDELKRLRDANATLTTDLADCEQANDRLEAELDACADEKATLQTDLDASRTLVAATASALVAEKAKTTPV